VHEVLDKGFAFSKFHATSYFTLKKQKFESQEGLLRVTYNLGALLNSDEKRLLKVECSGGWCLTLHISLVTFTVEPVDGTPDLSFVMTGLLIR
jgi:hypothetical protein